MKRILMVVLAVLIMGLATVAEADVLLDVSREMGPEPESGVEQFSFEVPETDTRIVLDISSTLSEGGANVRVLDPTGEVIHELSWKRKLTLTGDIVSTSGKTGVFQLEVSTDAAVGEWQIQVLELPEPSSLSLFLIPGPAMVLVALGSAIYWKRRSRTKWRWFWAGAGIWTVGVALKIASDVIFSQAILQWFEGIMPRVPYILVGGGYVGVHSAVFEIGITLAAALIWRAMARDANRAVAVGVGAGAFEALLLGVAVFVGILAALSGKPGTEAALAAAEGAALVTPLAWLVGPVERIIAILCHTSSRALVLLGVAKRRWSFFWWGFMIFAVLDGIAGVAHVSGKIGQFSIWWIELAIAPLAVASVPIIRWCMTHWPDGIVSAAREVAGAQPAEDAP